MIPKGINQIQECGGWETFHGLKIGPGCYFDILLGKNSREHPGLNFKKQNNNARHRKIRGSNSSITH